MSDAQGPGVLGRLRQRANAPIGGAPPPEPDDAVTGLPTRHAMPAALDEAVVVSRSDSTVAVLCFVEISHLRDVNDTFGPDAGDRLLKLVAQRLIAIDLPGTRVFRHEGAVFGVVFPRIPGLRGAEESARFLLEYLADPFVLDTHPVMIHPVVGGAVSTDSYSSLDDMIRDAYDALVRARSNEVDSFEVHDESKRSRYHTRIDERRLREAADRDEFQLHYQPIVRLSDGALAGVEALIRWDQPGATNTGMLYPNDFLPLLEKSGLIIRVGEWTLAEACRQVQRWQAHFPGLEPLFVSCNVGPRQLADPGFTTAVASAIDGSGLATQQLCVDLTDAALRQNQVEKDASRATLRVLKGLGVQVALGDFGAGNSSLRHLRDYQVDILRMHRLFATGLGVSNEDLIIFKHVAALAHDLDCRLVAEGVETEEQASLLPGLGVDYGQGYYFGRPQTADQIDGIIAALQANSDPTPIG